MSLYYNQEEGLRRVIVFFASFLVFISFPVVQNSFAYDLTLEDAINLAIENNLNLRRQQIDLSSSGYSERNLWAEIFPAINANLSAGYRTNLFSSIEPGNSGLNYNVGLGISLGLNAGIPYIINNISLAHQINILRFEDAVNQLSIQITKKYFSLIAEKNNLLLLEEIQNLTQSQYNRSQISFRNGLVGEITLLQSSLSLANARYNYNAASVAFFNNITEFLTTLGITPNNDITLSSNFEIIKIETNAEELITRHLYLRPDVIRNKQEIQRLENLSRQTSLQSRSPSLNLSIDWGSSNFDPFLDSISASARLSIPIDPWIPGSSRAQNITRASVAIERAKLDLEITLASAITQITSLSALLRGSWDSVLLARLGYEVAQRTYQLTENGFNNGTVEALTLQDVRNNMANSRQRLLQAELSYFFMILDLSAALNADWKNLIQNFGVTGEER